MDLNKEFPLKQQQYYDIQQLWVPTTPAKATSASIQRSQPPGSSWLEPTVVQCQIRSPSSSDLSNHLRGGDHTPVTSRHASAGSIIMLHSPSTSSGSNSSECWPPLMSGNVASCNENGTSKIPPCPPWLVQINRREMPSAQSMFMAKGKRVLGAKLSNVRCSCCGSHTDEHRLPATSIPNYDP